MNVNSLIKQENKGRMILNSSARGGIQPYSSGADPQASQPKSPKKGNLSYNLIPHKLAET